MPKGIYKRTKPVWNKGLTKENSEILKKQGKDHSKRMTHGTICDCCKDFYPDLISGKTNPALFPVPIEGGRTTHVCNECYKERKHKNDSKEAKTKREAKRIIGDETARKLNVIRKKIRRWKP
jgi:hypothetical protein